MSSKFFLKTILTSNFRLYDLYQIIFKFISEFIYTLAYNKTVMNTFYRATQGDVYSAIMKLTRLLYLINYKIAS